MAGAFDLQLRLSLKIGLIWEDLVFGNPQFDIKVIDTKRVHIDKLLRIIEVVLLL